MLKFITNLPYFFSQLKGYQIWMIMWMICYQMLKNLQNFQRIVIDRIFFFFLRNELYELFNFIFDVLIQDIRLKIELKF